MKRTLLLLGATMLSTPAFALDACKIVPQDPQVRICTYSPMQRYVVTGVVGYPVNLQFGDGEHIKRNEFAYTGIDSAGKPVSAWRGPPEKNDKGGESAPVPVKRFETNLPIWPFQEGHSSLIVITQRDDGTERAYQFDLTARKAGTCTTSEAEPGCPGDVLTTSQLSFTYPAALAAADKPTEMVIKAAAEKKQAAIEAWRAQQAQKAAEAQTVAVARLKQDIFYGKRNWAYKAKADPRYQFLAPSQVSDNGWITAFTWPENVQQPTITVVDPVTHEERSVFPQAQGRMQIVNTTASLFRLRLGKDAVMDIQNLAWSPERPNPETGTTSPDVVREVLYKDGKKQ